MASIPLPALAVQPPQNSPLTDVGKILALKSLLQNQQYQQQAQPLQLQEMQNQTQMSNLALQDRQKMTALQPQFVQRDETGKPTGFDLNGFSQAALGQGVSLNSLAPLQETYAKSVQAMAAAGNRTRK